jgi:tetratricopeptide (TPR) repeat protein
MKSEPFPIYFSYMKNWMVLFFVGMVFGLNAQTEAVSDSALIALDKANQAHALMDEAKFSSGLTLMKEAASYQPANYGYGFEVGFINFQLKNYAEAAKQLEKWVNHPKNNAELFQLLGNTYYILNDKVKAMNTFDVGLSKFPKSGLLFAEKGKLVQETDMGKALFYYEKGIEVDPNFDMNYFHAALLYFKQTESIKGILHGEIFMLLNRDSNFTAAMSELLYNAYKGSVIPNVEGKCEYHFCNPTRPDHLVDIDHIEHFPSFCILYSSLLNTSSPIVNVMNAANMVDMRIKALEAYYSHHFNEHYQEWVFDFQSIIKQAGHAEAYHHWVLMNGSELEFLQWKENNEEKWIAFTEWFASHDMAIPE